MLVEEGVIGYEFLVREVKDAIFLLKMNDAIRFHSIGLGIKTIG